jgi:pimeloyl-ACP methyl ester carboxylesterase
MTQPTPYVRTVRTNILEIAHCESGPTHGWPVILLHGFPYDIHAYDQVVPILAAAGARVFVPYLRGFGPTRFLSPQTMRSGQQAALGGDVIALLDALQIDSPILGGFDWGGLASCVAAALWPERIAGLVSYAGYDVIDVERLSHAFPPSLERVMWYQHLFENRCRESMFPASPTPGPCQLTTVGSSIIVIVMMMVMVPFTPMVAVLVALAMGYVVPRRSIIISRSVLIRRRHIVSSWRWRIVLRRCHNHVSGASNREPDRPVCCVSVG